MPKKKIKRTSSKRNKNTFFYSHSRIIILSVILLSFGIVGKTLLIDSESINVLGDKTFIAKGGDDSSDDNSDSQSSGSSNSEDSNDEDNDDSSGDDSLDDNNDDSSMPFVSSIPEIEIEDEDEDEDDNGVRTKTESKISEEKTEVRLSEAERIRTRSKDGRTRIDITSGGIKTRFEIRDDKVVIKVEQEDGTEVELEDEALLEIDDRLSKDDIKIATAGAKRFMLQKGEAGAVTNFPILVDLATNTVFINTPSGQREIIVLPEQAIQKLIAANVVNRLGARAVVDEATNNNLSSINQLITLGERNGLPVYEINGLSDQKLLGFIPVIIEKDVVVSAETGNAVLVDEPLFSRILDLISF